MRLVNLGFRFFLTTLTFLAAVVVSYFGTEWLAKNGLPRKWIEPVAFSTAVFLGSLGVFLIMPHRTRVIAMSIWAIAVIYPATRIASWFDPITEERTVLPYFSGVLVGALWLVFAAISDYWPGKSDRVSRSAKNQSRHSA